ELGLNIDGELERSLGTCNSALLQELKVGSAKISRIRKTQDGNWAQKFCANLGVHPDRSQVDLRMVHKCPGRWHYTDGGSRSVGTIHWAAMNGQPGKKSRFCCTRFGRRRTLPSRSDLDGRRFGFRLNNLRFGLQPIV